MPSVIIELVSMMMASGSRIPMVMRASNGSLDTVRSNLRESTRCSVATMSSLFSMARIFGLDILRVLGTGYPNFCRNSMMSSLRNLRCLPGVLKCLISPFSTQLCMVLRSTWQSFAASEALKKSGDMNWSLTGILGLLACVVLCGLAMCVLFGGAGYVVGCSAWLVVNSFVRLDQCGKTM